jgi:cystathionine gamma-synthase
MGSQDSRDQDTYQRATLAVSAGRPAPAPDGPVNPPIVASTTLHAGGPYGYIREWNETTSYLEDLMGQLENGSATAFSSGMAAANAIFDLVPTGGVIVASEPSYTAVGIRLQELADAGRLTLRLVDVTNADAMAAAIHGGGQHAPASWVWIESPTNPLMEICDIRATAHAARQVGAKLVVDNTFMTPMRQRPLELGAHVVMHSATKGLAGHSDVLMGALVTNDDGLADDFVKRRILMGAAPSAFDAFLASRGIRTLAIRVDRSEENAQELATRLSEHPAVSAVYYPGLAEHPGHKIHQTQSDGPGSVLSFTIHGTAEDAQKVCESVILMTHATSLGGVETLIERRRRWAHENPDVPDNLIRLSVGIENIEDLWLDLAAALGQITPK